MRDASPMFVGRDGELARLENLLERARQGTASLTLLEGEPGIGKTRLCEELCSLARAGGFLVARGAALGDAGAPALAPFRTVARTLGGELRALLDDETSDAQGVVDDARFRRFEAFAERLIDKSQERPLLIALDDLHDADEASLELLLFLSRNVREARLAMLATVRTQITRTNNTHDGHLTRLAREAEVLQVGPLGVNEVRKLAERAGIAAPERERIHALTRGNPLFVGELCTLLSMGGASHQARVPSSIASALRHKLGQLGEAAHALVEAAAILGGAPPLPALAKLVGVSLDGILARLGEPVRVGVLLDDGSLRVRFSHPLLREILLEDLPRDARARLHLACAQALEALAQEGHELNSAEIAHHRASALPLGEASQALSWLARASEEAERKLLVEEAATLTGLSVEVGGWACVSPGERCDLELAHARALSRAGARKQAREAATRATVLAESAKDSERLALAALARGADFSLGVVDHGLAEALEAARRALQPAGHEALLARVEGRLAAALQPADDPSEPMALARTAIARARRVGDRAVLLDTLVSAGSALVDYAPLAERIALASELVELAVELGQRPLALRGHLRLSLDHLENCDLVSADASMASYARISATLKAPQYHWTHPLLCAMRSAMGGRLSEAESLAEHGRAIGERSEDPNARLGYHLQSVVRMREFDATSERIERALGTIANLFEDGIIHVWTAVILASVHARAGDGAAALAALSGIPRSHPAFFSETTMMAMAVEIMAEQPELDEPILRRLLALMLPRKAQSMSWGVLAVSWDGPWLRYIGLAQLTLGQHDEAIASFEEARVMSERLGAAPAFVRATFELSRALWSRRHEGDGERSTALLSEVCERARALSMQGLEARARREQAARHTHATPATPPRPESGTPSLTLELTGELCILRFDGHELRMRDSRGLRMLARLIEAEGRELHVLELSGVSDPEAHSDAGEAVDARAIDSYRARAAELRRSIDEAETHADLHRAERARAELDALAEELSHSVGAFGRARRAGSNSERARVNVQRRLKDVIERARASAPKLALHLERSLKTGTFCSYRPEG